MLGDTSECPRYHLDPAIIPFQRMVKHYRAGHLPVGGGVLDQPTHLMEALELYDGLT